MTLRIQGLCFHQRDIDHWLKKFYEHLLDRGYHNGRILPLFSDAILNAHTFLATSDAYRLLLKTKKKEASRNQVFYKLKFHPGDPDSVLIQKPWRNYVIQPPGKPHVRVHTLALTRQQRAHDSSDLHMDGLPAN